MAIEILTLSELRCLCEDVSWREQWLAGQKPEIQIFDEDPVVKSLGALFQRLVAQFTYWLTAPSREADATTKLADRWALWRVLYDRFASRHIKNLLEQSDNQAAYFLTCALKSHCAKLETLWERIAPGIGWPQLYVTHAFALDAVPLPVGEAQISVSGSMDAVRNLGSGVMDIVEYKLGSGDQREKDLMQLAIYAKMLHITRPQVEFRGVLEYYQPELTEKILSAEALLDIYETMVAPLLLEVFKPATPGREGAFNTMAPLEAAGEEIRKCYAALDLNVEIVDIQLAAQFVRYIAHPQSGHNLAALADKAPEIKQLFYLDRLPLIEPIEDGVAIDVPKTEPQPVNWHDLVSSEKFRSFRDTPLAVILGKGMGDGILIADLNDPATAHLLIAGEKGSGKSEFLKSLVGALIAESHPSHLILSLVDATRRTFKSFAGSNFLDTPIIAEISDTISCLQKAADEMDRRLTLLSEEGHSDLESRIAAGQRSLPYWVIVFDEFDHLMLAGSKEKQSFEQLVFRLAGKGGKAGIHLLLATQRPDPKIITGPLKANLPLKICFRVSSDEASRLVIDQNGGDRLLGHGDFLCDRGQGIERAQAAVISQQELVHLAHLMI